LSETPTYQTGDSGPRDEEGSEDEGWEKIYPAVKDSFSEPGVLGCPSILAMTDVTVSTRFAFDGVQDGPPMATQVEVPPNTVPEDTEVPLASCGTCHSPAGSAEVTKRLASSQ
jgi:hypothetical protein